MVCAKKKLIKNKTEKVINISPTTDCDIIGHTVWHVLEYICKVMQC